MATKRPRAEEEKVWDAFQNCWTINGEPVDDGDNESDGEEFVSLKERRALREERLRKQRKRPVAEEEVEDEAPSVPEPQQQRALVDEAEDLRRAQQGMDKEKAKRAEEEARAKNIAARRRAGRMDDAERAMLIENLRNEHAKLSASYQRLPFVVDTLNRRARKEVHEAKLERIERDIETLGAAVVFVGGR